MRTLMTLALTIFSMTACAVDSTSNEPTARAAIELTDDDGDDVTGARVRCIINDDCVSGACDIITRACVTPEGEDDESEDDTDGPTQPDPEIAEIVPELEDDDAAVPPRDPPRPPARCTSNSHCESNNCDLARRMCMPAEQEPASPRIPDTESATSAEDELQAAPEHIACNPLVNCYPF